jgi:2-hydroxymuconate-semialdehyde hydrolase
MLAGLPLSQRRLDAAGVSTALLEGGAGSPLVLLHGGIESGGAYWAPVISRLVQNHRVAVPDAPGLGESQPTPVAHSLVGTLAERFAARGDSRSRLVVYAAPGIGRYRMPLGLWGHHDRMTPRSLAEAASTRPTDVLRGDSTVGTREAVG